MHDREFEHRAKRAKFLSQGVQAIKTDIRDTCNYRFCEDMCFYVFMPSLLSGKVCMPDKNSTFVQVLFAVFCLFALLAMPVVTH